jgi:hypothetical protein
MIKDIIAETASHLKIQYLDSLILHPIPTSTNSTSSSSSTTTTATADISHLLSELSSTLKSQSEYSTRIGLSNVDPEQLSHLLSQSSTSSGIEIVQHGTPGQALHPTILKLGRTSGFTMYPENQEDKHLTQSTFAKVNEAAKRLESRGELLGLGELKWAVKYVVYCKTRSVVLRRGYLVMMA